MGYCVLLEGNVISWKSKKQNVVARSTAEAKYRAMASLTCELIWVKQFLRELNFCEIQTMKMYCDNQAALHIASNPVFHERTKHIEIDCQFVRKKLMTKEICTEFVGSNDQLADVLTKSLRGPRIEFFCSKLGSYNLYASLRGRVRIITYCIINPMYRVLSVGNPLLPYLLLHLIMPSILE